MNLRQERPHRDRPMEVAAGASLAICGLIMLVTLAITGTADFAPRYLRETHDGIVAAYSLLALLGGVLTLLGLHWQYKRDAIFGRWMEAIGHFFMAGIAVTYAWDLSVGGFSSTGNTLLLAFLAGRVGGSLGRAYFQIRRNFLAVRVVTEAAAESENGNGDGHGGAPVVAQGD